MTRFSRRPSGLWEPEARGFRPGGGFRGGAVYTRSAGGSVYTPPPSAVPTVTNISPATGTQDGGTPVEITGTNFISGGLAATVGGVALTGVELVSSTVMRGVTGVHAVGAVNVVVTPTMALQTR